MLSYEEQKSAVQVALDSFPIEFGLRGFPGEKFRCSPSASYYSTSYGVMIYTQRYDHERGWLDFAKGSPGELRAQIVRCPD
jgi:hypothetical protein